MPAHPWNRGGHDRGSQRESSVKIMTESDKVDAPLRMASQPAVLGWYLLRPESQGVWCPFLPIQRGGGWGPCQPGRCS